MAVCAVARLFLSTPSARRATKIEQHERKRTEISIHALREEGDNSRSACTGYLDISIHALREEGDLVCCNGKFLGVISIHALREEGDFPLTT